jgi:uncharacterized protein YacL
MKIPPLLFEWITGVIALCAAALLASKLNISFLAQISFTILIAAISLLMIRLHLHILRMHDQLLIRERMMKFTFDDFSKQMSKRQEESLRQLSDAFEEYTRRIYR